MTTASPERRRPRLVVFDLDGTLWYPEMYMLWGGGGAPFKRISTGDVIDRSGTHVRLMGNSRSLLAQLHADPNTQVAVASCTDEPSWADECMRKISVGNDVTMKQCIDFEEIHKHNKRVHFENLHRRTRIPYEHMIFFDNERRNCRAVAPLGIHCVYVPDGMTDVMWNDALRDFAAQPPAAEKR